MSATTTTCSKYEREPQFGFLSTLRTYTSESLSIGKVSDSQDEQPHLAIIIFMIGVLLALPILVIIGFGLSVVVITFIGILFLEGTLLAIISMLLIFCLAILVFVMFLFVAILLAIFFGLSHIYEHSKQCKFLQRVW